MKRIYLVFFLFIFGSNVYSYGDYKCFIDPMDKYPENRVNVVPTLGAVYVMHVSLSDRKTLLSEPSVYRITKQKLISNMETHVISKGIFAVSKNRNKYGKHNGIFYHNNDGNEDGYLYLCERIRIIRD